MKKLITFRHYALIFATLMALAGWQSTVYAEPAADSSDQVSATVNINTASAAEIAESLTGVGEAKAAAIVAYRNKNGAFTSLDDLLAVSGIGEKTLEKNAASIRF